MASSVNHNTTSPCIPEEPSLEDTDASDEEEGTVVSFFPNQEDPAVAIDEEAAVVDDVSSNETLSKLQMSHRSRASVRWDREGKGYLTRSERVAKELDKDGKGYLNADEAAALGSRVNTLLNANKRITRMLWGCIILSVVLFLIAMVSVSVLISRSKELTVDEDGMLSAVSGGNAINVNSQGIEFHSYHPVSKGDDMDDDDDEYTDDDEKKKICVSAFDLARAWHQNKKGGGITLVISTDEEEEVIRLENADSKMTKDAVSFGDVEFRPDPDCGAAGGSKEDARRSLREHVQAFKDGTAVAAARRLKDNAGYAKGGESDDKNKSRKKSKKRRLSEDEDDEEDISYRRKLIHERRKTDSILERWE